MWVSTARGAEVTSPGLGGALAGRLLYEGKPLGADLGRKHQPASGKSRIGALPALGVGSAAPACQLQ